MREEQTHQYTNRLINETSPYLLQHAHNPVDWHPWGDEALHRAQKEDRPILLSIGYSACHWCHVMEHESFEDPDVAGMMNKHFVCIKVDREERPDIDNIYMAATLAINNGQGGWPMTVFLTPEQRPFFAGTYFPPVEHYGRPSFTTVLSRISELWKTDRDTLLRQGATLTEHLRQQTGATPSQSIGHLEIETAVTQLSKEFDPTYGGFGSAPKFPPSTALSLLLRYHHRSGDPVSLKMVQVTLDAMAKGGMYDQIGGGFARYSTDHHWLVPHFEKMLYDNALLTRIYLEAYQVTAKPLYRQIATEVLDYILREMTSPEGGFYSATDADSEGVEGKFFVWTPSEIFDILGKEEGRRFCAYYDITEQGNWEGKSIPNTPRTIEEIAERLGMTSDALTESLRESRRKVYNTRLQRTPPGLDDKILTAWNGLMIGAMANGGRVLEDQRYLKAAERAADFLLTTLTQPDGRLLRTYRSGKAHLNAYLEDYAYLCEALIDLYEAGGAPRFLIKAVQLAERLMNNFATEDQGGFFSTAQDHENLLFRHRDGYDGAIPNANAAAAHALTRLSFYLDRADMRKAAVTAIEAHGKTIKQFPRAFCKSLAVVDLLLKGPVELAIIGRKGTPDFGSLQREINKTYLPNHILIHKDPADPEGHMDLSLPLLEGKGLMDGKPAIYICHNFTCQTPITDPSEVAPALHRQQGIL